MGNRNIVDIVKLVQMPESQHGTKKKKLLLILKENRAQNVENLEFMY